MQQFRVHPVEQRSRLHAGHQEDKSFEEIDQQIPEEDSLQPRRRRNEQRPVPADEQPGRHRRQDARTAQLLRHQERQVRRQQRQRDLDARIARPAAQAQAEPADGDAVGDLAHDDESEGAGGVAEGEQAGAHRGHREAVEDQGRGVIGEPLALQHDDQPARHAETAHDRQRRDRIGRRDNGAEQKADGPRHAEQPVHGGRHRAGGEDHGAKGQQRDRAQIETEFAPAHGDARRIDQRRQDAEQHQLRRQLDPRQAGRERKPNAGDDEQDRRRGIEPPRHDGDHRQHGEQQQYGLNRRRHGAQVIHHPGAGIKGWRNQAVIGLVPAIHALYRQRRLLTPDNGDCRGYAWTPNSSATCSRHSAR